jgi:ParB-like chromosome segregation protein Spo0J
MQQLEEWPIDRLIDYARNPRKNDHAVDAVAGAIREFGFKVPIVAKSDGTVVDGHLRLKAAKKLKLETVPVLLADDLTDAQVRAFRISVNKMAELADWDSEMLANELSDLHADEFDMSLLGFDVDELTKLMGLTGDIGFNDSSMEDFFTEVTADQTDALKVLSFKLSPEQHEAVCKALATHDKDPQAALLKVLGL